MTNKPYVPEGIVARLEGYKTEESRKFYQEEKDVGQLHGHYVEDVGQLLLMHTNNEQRIIELEEKLKEYEPKAGT